MVTFTRYLKAEERDEKVKNKKEQNGMKKCKWMKNKKEENKMNTGHLALPTITPSPPSPSHRLALANISKCSICFPVAPFLLAVLSHLIS